MQAENHAVTIIQRRSGRVIRVKPTGSARRRRTKMLATMLYSIFVTVCCCLQTGWSQEPISAPANAGESSFSLGSPNIAGEPNTTGEPSSLGWQLPAENGPGNTEQMIEADRFTPYNRLPPPPSESPVLSASPSSPVSLAQQRPEYPNDESLPSPIDRTTRPNPSTNLEPIVLDWSLLEPSSGFPSEVQAAEPISIIPNTESINGCVTCGSSRLHAHSLSRGERLSGGIFAALCPCDDCYQPKWDLQQSAAFFVDSARPQTRTRFGWDFGANMILADRAEYFWARSGVLGPAVVPEFNYHELSMYTEVAKGGFSFFTSLPYRSLYLRDAGHEAGFADMRIGTKSLVHDSPLLQIAFQMTTHIPSAQSIKGLGTAHVSLEPALLVGMRLSRHSFLQAQVAQWIPIGGDPDYAGSLARWGISWNRLAWQLDETTQMTTNLEVFGWSFQDGAYTDPILGPFQKASNETYVYLGPGCRLLICNKWELGVGGAFALSDRHFAESLIRSEFTMRF